MGENLSRRGVIAGIAGLASGALAAEPAFAGHPGERAFAADPRARPGRRPNILVILGDDLGWADLSSFGSTHISTPHLDELARGGVEAHLTPTEFDLLVHLAARPGAVHDRDALLARVWGWADATGTRTVDSHVKALRRKLGADLIRTVHGVGYALEVAK